MLNERIFVSVATVYRILNKEGLLMSRKVRRRDAGERYVQEPTRPGELWATDVFLYDNHSPVHFTVVAERA